MLIHYQTGRMLTGILLSLKGSQMRVAVKNPDELVEFRLVNDVWISESCETVVFEFPTAIFEAVGIAPDPQNMEPQSDFVWNWGITVDQTN